MQRKLIALLCYQMAEEEGRQRALKTARAIAERALSELIICHQNTSSLSSNLWSAVRARGCQFLGPGKLFSVRERYCTDDFHLFPALTKIFLLLCIQFRDETNAF